LSIVANCDEVTGKVQIKPLPHSLESVEKKLRSLALDGISASSILGQAIEHQLNMGGSRTRAQLSLQINHLLTIPLPDSIALAALCELLHQAALVHDDLQDNESTRREQPSVWYKFGKDCALCTGDLLISAAYAAIGECTETSHHRRILATTHLFIKQIVSGQMKDIQGRHGQLTLADYEVLVQAKSGALLILPLAIAFAYQHHTVEQRHLYQFFEDYALAYQAIDDLQDYHQDWLATNALKSPNIVAIMLDKHDNLNLAKQAVNFYIETILQRMQQISKTQSFEWQELLSTHIKQLQKSNDKLRQKNQPEQSTCQQALVIGGGFGGIAAALRLKAKGYSVKLIDKCPRLGGRAQVYMKEGFRHDAGPTVITAPFLLAELFELFGKKIEDYIVFKDLNPWYRFVFADGSTFNYGGTVEETLAEIARFNPADQKGYLRLLNASKKIFEVGFQQLSDKPFHQFSRMLLSIPQLIRLKSYRTVWQLVSHYIRDPRLRQAFSIQPLLVGGNPFDTTCIYSLIHYLERQWGVCFPMGGTGALIDALTQLLKEEGVEIQLNTTVSKINISNKKAVGVKLEDGTEINADLIVSNADPAYCYTNMIAPQHQKLFTRFKTRNAKFSMGLFVLYFGTTRTYPLVAHHTIWLAERFESLLSDIFDHKILCEDFSMYIHRPTATDSSFAPANCDSFYVLVPVPNLQGDVNWSKQAKPLRDRIVSALSRTILPDLERHIVADFYRTPKDFEHDYFSTHGAGFSIAPIFLQSAWFRYHNRAENIEGLYHVGAGTHPGAGIPGVLSSAKVVDNMIKSVLKYSSLDVQVSP
jgi:phytoene desaturase